MKWLALFGFLMTLLITALTLIDTMRNKDEFSLWLLFKVTFLIAVPTLLFYGIFTSLTEEIVLFLRIQAVVLPGLIVLVVIISCLSALNSNLKSLPSELLLKVASNFRWFLKQQNRELFDLTIADLKRDRTDMIRRKFEPSMIRVIIFWGVVRSIVPILWNAFIATLRQLAIALNLIRQIIKK